MGSKVRQYLGGVRDPGIIVKHCWHGQRGEILLIVQVQVSPGMDGGCSPSPRASCSHSRFRVLGINRPNKPAQMYIQLYLFQNNFLLLNNFLIVSAIQKIIPEQKRVIESCVTI